MRRSVRVQVFHHQHDLLGGVVPHGDVAEEVPRSILVSCAVTMVMRLPASGSVAMKTLYVPRHRYS